MLYHNLPIGQHLDYFAGWRYLLNRDYRAGVHRRWQRADWYDKLVDRLFGALSVVFTTFLFTTLGAAILHALF
jgi:predicted P-loop ATPase